MAIREFHVGGCQNYGPFLGALNIRRRTIIGTQKGTIILTTTHMQTPALLAASAWLAGEEEPGEPVLRVRKGKAGGTIFGDPAEF